MPSKPRMTSFWVNSAADVATRAARPSDAPSATATTARWTSVQNRESHVRFVMEHGCRLRPAADRAGALGRLGHAGAPWKTIPRAGNPTQVAAAIAGEAGAIRRDDDGLAAIVVGLPRQLDGEPTEQTAAVARSSPAARNCAIPVVLQDERLTSHEAERAGAARRDWRKRKADRRRRRGDHSAGLSRRAGRR